MTPVSALRLAVTLFTLVFDSVVVGLPNVSLPLLIIGGNSTDIIQHPYQVAIWSNKEFRGSGALVAKGWAITTASIVFGFDADTLRVRTRSSLASSGGDLYSVTKVVVHSRFRFSNMTFDVALLKLGKPLMTSSSRDHVTSRERIPLARGPLPADATAVLSGWGSTTMWAKLSEQLLETSMKSVNTSDCQTVYKRQLLHTLFCAKAEDVYGPCWGDRGDLLVYEGRLYGLLSWNKGCYQEVFPSVFTDIHTVHHWVMKVIGRRVHRNLQTK